MANAVVMKHSSGVVREGYEGFSWTALFFGLFVPLLRGDLKHVVIYFIVAALMLMFTWGLTLPVLWITYGVCYNKWHMESLQLQGFSKSGTPS